MSFSRTRLCLCVALVLSMVGSGCSRTKSLRQRYFTRPETAVPSAELAPRQGESNLDLNASRSRSRGQYGRNAAGVVDWRSVGESVEARPIEVVQLGNGARRVLLIGGIHGDEPEGQPLIERLAKEFSSDRSLARSATVLFVRDLNPDGTAAQTRSNKNGVDLNRNFPASNWDKTARSDRFNPGPRPESEPETRVLVSLIRDFQPDRILVMHATRGKPMVNYDGPARELAEAMSRLNGYSPSDTIGYPTPGSLGSYAGVDRGIPIITLELARGIPEDAAWQQNHAAVLDFLR